MTTNTHPELIAAILDRLATASGWLYTSELSMAVTTDMRRLVQKGIVTDQEVMTFNATGNYYEVTGQTISRILGKRHDVQRRVVRRQAEYALTSNVDRWADEYAKRLAVHASAESQVGIRERDGFIQVVVYGTPETAPLTTGTVAAFSVALYGEDTARKFAEEQQRKVVGIVARSALGVPA